MINLVVTDMLPLFIFQSKDQSEQALFGEAQVFEMYRSYY